MKLFVLAVAVIAAVLVGCGDDTDSAPDIDVVGLWDVSGEGAQAQVRYRADGPLEGLPCVSKT